MRTLDDFPELDEFPPSYFNGFELLLSDLELDEDEFDKQDISGSIANSKGLEDDNDPGDIDNEFSKKLGKTEKCKTGT